MKTNRLLVLGYGNSLRRDDGAGPEVARRLGCLGLSGVEAVGAHQLLPEHAETLSRFERVVFVDAATEAGTAGVRLRRIGPAAHAGFAVHHTAPTDILALALRLFGRAPASWLITIPALDLGIGEGLSSPVDRWCDDAVAEIGGIWAEGGTPMARPA